MEPLEPADRAAAIERNQHGPVHAFREVHAPGHRRVGADGIDAGADCIDAERVSLVVRCFGKIQLPEHGVGKIALGGAKLRL